MLWLVGASSFSRTKWFAHEAHESLLYYFILIFIMLFIYLLQIISKLTKEGRKNHQHNEEKKEIFKIAQKSGDC